MPIEIERKFLVDVGELKKANPEMPYKFHISQGYLSNDPAVRIRTADKEAWITVKGKGLITRAEFEYHIPNADAVELLGLCKSSLEKNRYIFTYGHDVWEVDEFLREHLGLWVAEIELDSPDQVFSHPSWVGKEVTNDHRYQNVYLAEHKDRFWDPSSIHR
jgi:adenylate cyclase